MTKFITPDEIYPDHKDYAEFEFNRRDVRRIGREEVNRKKQFIGSGYK